MHAHNTQLYGEYWTCTNIPIQSPHHKYYLDGIEWDRKWQTHTHTHRDTPSVYAQRTLEKEIKMCAYISFWFFYSFLFFIFSNWQMRMQWNTRPLQQYKKKSHQLYEWHTLIPSILLARRVYCISEHEVYVLIRPAEKGRDVDNAYNMGFDDMKLRTLNYIVAHDNQS